MIRSSTLQFSARKKKATENELLVLERKLELWSNQQIPGFLCTRVNDRVDSLKRDIEKIYAYKAQGAAIRCKARWADLAEKPTKYFLNLEKSNFNRRAIHRLKNKENKVLSDAKEIEKELTQYFKNIYTLTGNCDLSYLEKLDTVKLTDEQKQLLDEKITQEEIGMALY